MHHRHPGPMHAMMPHYSQAISATPTDPAAPPDVAQSGEGLRCIIAAGGSFLAANAVSKALPPTAAWALGWGMVATLGTLLVARKVLPQQAPAAALGVAAAYLHSYSHQTSFPHRK